MLLYQREEPFQLGANCFPKLNEVAKELLNLILTLSAFLPVKMVVPN